MPFVQRIVEPKYLSRTSLWDVDGNPRVTDDELEAVTNNTLSNALRQLASLVLAANDIFAELRDELRGIARRSEKLKSRIDLVEDRLAAYDPKKVTVRAHNLLVRKAHLLIYNANNNNCESLMNIVARFNMGKRLNLIQRGSYERRVHLAALRYNKSLEWHRSAWRECSGRNLSKIMETYISKSIKKHSYKRPVTNKTFPYTQRTTKVNTDYGACVDEPEEEEDTGFIISEAQNYTQTLQLSREQINKINEETIGQFNNVNYSTYRKNRLTSSLFGRVIRRRPQTSCHNIVKSCLEGSCFSTPATEYGKAREGVVINKFEELYKMKVNRSGLWICEDQGFLAASPDAESDICSFAQLKTHFAANYDLTTNLFSATTRPRPVQALYEAAAKTPIHLMRQMDKWRRDGHRSSRFFLCTPVLGARRRKIRSRIDIDIETRMPAAVEELRRWTSNEAIGDVTITPDCQNRVPPASFLDGDVTDGTLLSDEEPLDHKLPSPEEQAHVLAMKFPPEVVVVDISGRNFDRLSLHRRSLLHTDPEDGSAVRRKGRTRKPRSRRRNTIAGTDQKELRDAVTCGDETTSPMPEQNRSEPAPITGSSTRSKSSDILRCGGGGAAASKKESPEPKKSHFNSLKQWGKNRLKMINSKHTETAEQSNTYETVSTVKRKTSDRKTGHERQPSCSSSSEKSTVSTHQQQVASVKLRDSSQQRRMRRSGENKDEMHSSSGNWSASSESGRASIGSEITALPKSTTSAATSSNSLNTHPPGSVNSRRRYNANASTSGSVTSEGTLTPDIIHDLHEDGETSSVYSCDTEGYYTSFHVDSGLKTLKEEDGPVTPLHSTTAFSNSSSSNVGLTAENEYELFGRGSTSTTTSSAGTVCTTLRASESSRSLSNGPAVPERKSSLNKEKSPESSLERDVSSDKTGTVKRSPLSHKPTVVGVIHKNEQGGDVSPDSGHNTSNSPIESASSPNGNRSCSEFEFSESSDMEGADRIERIRVKTAINSSRIPSMCAITPPHSDDESVKNYDMVKEKNCRNQSRGTVVNKENFPASGVRRSGRGVEETNLDDLDILKETTQSKTVQIINVNPISGYATIETVYDEGMQKTTTNTSQSVRAASPSGGTLTVKETPPPSKTASSQPIFKATLMPLNNMFGKLKSNLSNLRKSETKEDFGDYSPDAKPTYDSVNKNLKAVLSGKIKETEYVSLNELPLNDAETDSLERRKRGARVTLNAEGKVVYSSDSLPRRKGATTFEPGPFVKKIGSPVQSPVPEHRNLTVRPVNQQDQSSRPLSPQLGKVVIRASSGTTEIVRMPPATIVTPTSPKPNNARGAYVHVLAANCDNKGLPHLPSKSQADQHRNHAMEADFGSPTPYYFHRDANYSTLPTRKVHHNHRHILNELPERSVTPDITRDLGRRKYESPGRDFKEKHQSRQYQVLRRDNHNSTDDTNIQVPSSSTSLKISPIDPKGPGTFHCSTPAPKASDLKAAVNLENRLLSPKKSTMSNEELYAVIHKSKKKLNIGDEANDRDSPVEFEFSPKVTPKSPETGYLGDKPRNRLSWSPGIDDLGELKEGFSNDSRSRQSWACKDRKGSAQTSRLDFKKLLLQHSKQTVPTKNTKLSAVEQLKLSKQLPQPTPTKQHQDDLGILELSRSPRTIGNRKFNTLNSPRGTPDKPRPAPKLLSPRSQWRFASPRSDVLSSTIPEDCREDESPNSSGERRRSRHLEETDGGKSIVQNLFGNGKSFDNCKSIAERLQAQRARFFSGSGNSPPTAYRNRETTEKSVRPALETAF